MKNVIKREQCKLACGLPSVNILSKVSKFKVLLYLKKSGLDKQGKAPIMGRITLNRSNLFACQSKNSMAQSHVNYPVIPSYGTFVLADWMERVKRQLRRMPRSSASCCLSIPQWAISLSVMWTSRLLRSRR